MDETGLLSSDFAGYDETLRTANKVFVRYCTSDAHMGHVNAFGYKFRGQSVVESVLSDLVHEHGLGSDLARNRHLLLFGGASAGSRGAMVHLDYVSSMIGRVSGGVDVVGFLDSPLWLDYAPLDASFEGGFANQTKQVHNFANVRHLGEGCEAHYDEANQWRCLLGEYRMPFVTSPYFLIAAKHDWFQLNFLVGRDSSNFTPAMLDYAAAFANRTAVVVDTLAASHHAVFAPACYSHAKTLSDAGFFKDGLEDGVTAYGALRVFLQEVRGGNKNGEILKLIDSCFTFDCGKGCHSGDDPCKRASDVAACRSESKLRDMNQVTEISGVRTIHLSLATFFLATLVCCWH